MGWPMFRIVVVVGRFGIGVIVHPLAEMIAEFKASVSIVTVLEINQPQSLHAILARTQLALIDQTVALVHVVMT